MTNIILTSFGWCILQVTLVVLAGIVVSKVVSVWSLRAACLIVCRSAAICILLTTVAFLPIHRVFVLLPSPTDRQAPSTAIAFADQHDSSRPLDSRTDSTPPMFNVRDLVVALQSVTANVKRFETRNGITIQILYWFLLAAITIGHLRLMAGITYVWRLRRHSIPIGDPNLLNMVRSLANRLGLQVAPELRESHAVTDAAVAGWLQPVLILPCDWRSWSDEERRAVLAHELAHLVRWDSLWRVGASELLAIHFYNPFAHWLLRRVVLYQELLADMTAADVVGRSLYLRSLSRLAIQRDDRTRLDASAGLLPVFSGHLMRRITMLNSKEGRTDMYDAGKRKILSAAVSTAFLVLGLAAVATRGIAEQPRDESKSETKTLKQASFTQQASDSPTSNESVLGLFRRAPLALSTLAVSNPIGVSVVRLQELLKQPEIKSYTPTLDLFASSLMASSLKLKAAPPISFESIEWFAARPIISAIGKTKEKKSQIVIGSGVFSIKLNQPFDLKQWFQQYAPDAPHHIVEGKDLFEVDAIILGPVPCLVWAADAMTLRICMKRRNSITPETILADLEDDVVSDRVKNSDKADVQPAGQNISSNWQARWDRIDTGLVNVVIAKADISGLLSELDDEQDAQNVLSMKVRHLIVAMQSRCTDTALALDVAGHQSMMGIKCQFGHSSQATALQTAQELQELLKAATTELLSYRETLKKEGDKADELKMVSIVTEVLATSTLVSVDEFEDGAAATVVTVTMPFDRFIECALQIINNDLADEQN